MTPGARDRRPLAALYIANGVSLTGNVMTLTAIPWFVLRTTGSASKTGLIAFFAFVPVVLASIVGGALVDRLGSKRTSIAADVMSGVTVALIPLLHVAGGLSFTTLAILVFLGGLLDTPGMSARSALVPALATRAAWPLERATGVTATVERGARLAGAPLAGLLIVLVGPINVLWIDAATFAFSAALVAFAVPDEARQTRLPGSRYLAELREGFSFLRTDRPLRAIATLIMTTNFLDAMTSVFLVVYVNEVFGSAAGLGGLIGVGGAGSVIGALAFARYGRRFSRYRLFAWCFVGVTIRYPAFAAFAPLGVLLAVTFGAGFASGPLNPLIDTVSYERIPERLRGRVLSALSGVAWMAMPIGVLVAGVVLDQVGLRPTAIAVGIAYLAATGTIWLSGAMRAMDAKEGLSKPGPSAVPEPAATSPGVSSPL